MGHKVDILISRQTMLRVIGASLQSHPSIHEQHRTQARLHDGTVLEGYLTTAATLSNYQFDFVPLKRQPDGTRWIVEDAVKTASLPQYLLVLRRGDVQNILLPLRVPQEESLALAPAFVKMFLGFAYSAWGHKAVSSPYFNPVRDYVHGTESVDVAVVEVGADGRAEQGGVTVSPPRHLTFPNHMLWGRASSGRLVGAVSLFGKVTLCLQIPDFGLDLEGRIAEVTNICDGVTQLIYGSPQPPTNRELMDYLQKNKNK